MIPILLAGCSAGAPPPAPAAPEAAPEPVAVSVPRPPPLVEPLAADLLRARLFAPTEWTRVVNFWATWCEPCIAELPHLRALAAAHPEVQIVMVNLDLPKLRQSKVEPFVKQHELTGFTHLQLDDSDALGALQRVVDGWPDAIPVTLVVDGSGAIVKRHAGALSAADAERLIP